MASPIPLLEHGAAEAIVALGAMFVLTSAGLVLSAIVVGYGLWRRPPAAGAGILVGVAAVPIGGAVLGVDRAALADAGALWLFLWYSPLFVPGYLVGYALASLSPLTDDRRGTEPNVARLLLPLAGLLCVGSLLTTGLLAVTIYPGPIGTWFDLPVLALALSASVAVGSGAAGRRLLADVRSDASDTATASS